MSKFFTFLFILSLFAIPHGFVFAEGMPSPVITSVSPSTIYFSGGYFCCGDLGDQNDNQAEINGQGFGDPKNINSKVVLLPEYGSPAPKIISWSDTKIIIQIDSTNVFGSSANALKVYAQDDNISTYKRSPFSNEVSVKILSAICKKRAWVCYSWSYSCSADGIETRGCEKNSGCEASDIPSPPTSQSCTPPPQPRPVTPATPPAYQPPQLQPIAPITQSPVYQPPQPLCDADTWTCGDWNSCSLSGVQKRSCRKTFDCPSVETAPPTTDQYCEGPNRPTQQIPQNSGEISNQDTIIKATVKLICPLDANRASQGSGTIIDPSGTILTNQHVINGTLGCLVGFINNFNDEPYFGDRQIADIVKVSPNEDIAILKLRNPQDRKLLFIDIAKGTSDNLRLGTKVTIYGYPAKFGTNITYTSGDFSGTDKSYLKTTAIIEHGNSGGGAYLSDGTFIGMPSAVIRGELNALGYILSITTINSWLGNSSAISYSQSNNNYSRVSSILENINLKKLGSLQLVIPGKSVAVATPSPASKNNQQPSGQVKSSTPSTVISDQATKQNNQNPALSTPQPQLKSSWIKRFFQWAANLF